MRATWEERESVRAWRLPVDVYSTEEEVEITIEGDTLTIRGELPAHLENVNYLFQERPVGKFIRVLNLNIPVDAGKAEAAFENGLLTLVIPKSEDIKPRQIKVKTK